MASTFAKDWWKYALGVGALVAAVVIFWRQAGDPDVIPNTIPMVCVATGEHFTLSRGDVKTVPWTNPRTGEATLVPCVTKDGKTLAMSRYRDVVAGFGEKNKFVDPKTLEVKKPG